MRELVVTAPDAVLSPSARPANPTVFRSSSTTHAERRAAHNRAPDVLAVPERSSTTGPLRARPTARRDVAACAADVPRSQSLSAWTASPSPAHQAGTARARDWRRAQRSGQSRRCVGASPPLRPVVRLSRRLSDLNVAASRRARGERCYAAAQHVVEQTAGDPDEILDEIVAELPEPDRIALARPDIRSVFRDAVSGALRSGLRIDRRRPRLRPALGFASRRSIRRFYCPERIRRASSRVH